LDRQKYFRTVFCLSNAFFIYLIIKNVATKLV
jgi:hypothetical protein